MTPTTSNNHPVNWDDLLSCLLKGVQEAITDTSLQGVRHLAVQGKHEQAGKTGSDSRYTFALTDEWEPGASVRVHIQLDPADPTQIIAGTILSTFNASMTFVTEAPLPESSLEKIWLVEDRTWLLQRLQASLTRLLTRGETATRMGAKLFGPCPVARGYGTPQAQIPLFVPNAEQARALSLGMESELLLVIGPPGTGKTATESALAIEYLLAGKTVLLAAHTNKALDTVMLRLKAYCEQSGNAALLQSHQIVRIGAPLDLDETCQDITLQGIVSQHLGELALEQARLQQEQLDLQEALANHTAALRSKQTRWEKVRAQWQIRCETMRQQRLLLEQREQQRLAALVARLVSIEGEQKTIQQRLRTEEQVAQQAAQALQHAYNSRKERERALQMKSDELAALRVRSLAGRFFSRLQGKTEQVLVKENHQCLEALKQAMLAATEHEQRRDHASLSLSKLAEHISQLRVEEQQLQSEQETVTHDAAAMLALTTDLEKAEQALWRGESGIKTLAEKVRRLQLALSFTVSRLEEIALKEQSLALDVVHHARLIGTTLAGITTSASLRDRLFDAVMVDEASMASLALVLVAVEHATRHMALFGDPRQFAPIVQLTNKERAPAAAYWLGTDVFSHLHVRLDNAASTRMPTVFLREQSRMLPEIAAPISQMIYGGQLRDRQDLQRIPMQLAPHPEWPLMLVDTSDIDRRKQPQEPKRCLTLRSSYGSSKYNLYHVDCVIRLIKLLLPQFPERGKPCIGVVTPYAAQKARIRQALQALGLLHRVHVGTVYSFQSVEYPCVIFDIPEGYGVAIGRFISDVWGWDDIASNATRLLNVAHTRAQEKLIYIANVAYIRRDASRKEHLLTQLVNYVAEQGCVDSQTLFPGQ